MSNVFKNITKSLVETVYKYFGNSSGNMILLTSIIGVALSSIAQTGAVLLNKNYSTSQKAFMAPQELAEGCMTIFSMLLITRPIQGLAKKYVSSGKILTTDMKKYLEKHSLLEKRGNADFNLPQSVNNIVEKIKISDEFVKASENKRNKLLFEHTEVLNSYDRTLDATSAIATTAGGILSTAIVSPLIKNLVASKYQSVTMDTISKYNNGCIANSTGLKI